AGSRDPALESGRRRHRARARRARRDGEQLVRVRRQQRHRRPGADGMRACPYSIEQLLPLAPPMILLDAVESYDEASVIARVSITPRSLFVRDGGVPSYIGLEYMAQACGAFAGAVALDHQRAVRVGLLLGTRNYRMARPFFGVGQRLAVGAVLRY